MVTGVSATYKLRCHVIGDEGEEQMKEASEEVDGSQAQKRICSHIFLCL